MYVYIYATNIELIALIRLALKNGFVIYSRLQLSFRLSTPTPFPAAWQASQPASQPFVCFACAMCLKYLSLAQIIIQLHSFWWHKFHIHTHTHTHTYICTYVNLNSLKSMNWRGITQRIVQMYAPQLVFSRYLNVLHKL